MADFQRPHRTANRYGVLNSLVDNRGHTPDDFLDELIPWGRSAPEEIFVRNNSPDIYSSVRGELGPWHDNLERRCAMLEVMRVLAGFESSWDWNAGRDTHNPDSTTPTTIEAGAWQVSANSVGFGNDLRALVLARVGSTDGTAFQAAMKSDHELAMEYVARLLRHTINHHGPVRDHHIHRWLRRDAVEKFKELVQ